MSDRKNKDDLKKISKNKVNTDNQAIKKRDPEKVFRDLVAELKRDRPGDASMVLFLRDQWVAQGVVAWVQVDRRLSDDIKDDPWDMIWYSPFEWMEAAGVPKDHRKGVEKVIKSNGLIYPDGTLPNIVQRFLINEGRRLLDMPVLPPTPPKESPIGVKGQRDPNFPCEAFELRGESQEVGDCEGDGHYMCAECLHFCGTHPDYSADEMSVSEIVSKVASISLAKTVEEKTEEEG